MIEVSRTTNPSVVVIYDNELRQFFTLHERKGKAIDRRDIELACARMRHVEIVERHLNESDWPVGTKNIYLKLRNAMIDVSCASITLNIDILYSDKQDRRFEDEEVKELLGDGFVSDDGYGVWINLSEKNENFASESFCPNSAAYY